MKAIAVCSGGLDSTVMLYKMIDLGYEPIVLSFDYGQRHGIELSFIEETAKRLHLRWILTQMPGYKSALTTTTSSIPKANYDDNSQKVTVVPNRNMIMIAIAAGYAIQEGAQEVWYAAHSGDHAIYPDCRPEFVHAMAQALHESNYERIQLVAPFMELTKAQIVSIGAKLGVRFEETWSCYDPVVINCTTDNNFSDRTTTITYLHCGECGTCRERIEAFKLSGVRDPTSYVIREGGKV